MKIYPGKHSICNVSSVDVNEEVVLGYVDSEFIEEEIKINIEDEFSKSSRKEVLPYDIFKLDNEITLFNKNGTPVDKALQDNILIRQEDSNYAYIPNASIVFEPLSFTYRVLAKKKMKYNSSRKYNISTTCSNEELAKKMIQFFADATERHLCPTNVKFNNGDVKINSLLNSSLLETDFVFINSKDGKTYKNKNIIDINKYISSNAIPWIICDEDNTELDLKTVHSDNDFKFELENEIMSKANPYITKNMFYIPSNVDGVKYHNLFKYNQQFTPILIKEHINKGFVVYCQKDFMDKLADNYLMFYEIMMYLYLNNYALTPMVTEWIADEMPDFIVKNNRLTQKDKFTSHMELHKLLNLQEDDVYPIEIKINPPAPNKPPVVFYTGMSSNYLVFKKMKTPEYADPIKEKGQISIYTEKHNIMYYDNFIYTVEESMENKISAVINNNTLKVIVQPFKNTFLGTSTFVSSKILTFDLSHNSNQEIYIVWNKETKDLELSLNNVNKCLLATIQVIKNKKESKLYDMRRRGGGLPEHITDNFNCLDIGNTMGRPYRKGGALIATINLPKKYETHSELYDIIHNSIKKNMIAEDHLILNINYI